MVTLTLYAVFDWRKQTTGWRRPVLPARRQVPFRTCIINGLAQWFIPPAQALTEVLLRLPAPLARLDPM